MNKEDLCDVCQKNPWMYGSTQNGKRGYFCEKCAEESSDDYMLEWGEQQKHQPNF